MSKENITLPLDNIEILSGELFFISGGTTMYAPGTGCGCECNSNTEVGIGCICGLGSGCGCECTTGVGCGCGCTQPTSALE